ncbi:MAG: hypothetical protein HZB42_08175 [Sphingobacteriales bacterium]|nr:hypothetical protein [Sphingobacteriales bacterium]
MEQAATIKNPPPPGLFGKNDGSVIILGTPKVNPYTVSNMQSAYSTLSSSGIIPSHPINIRTTYYYVKFKPQNSNQYQALTSDTTIDFSDIPIEANITQDGDYYHDPSLPDSIPTYQYAAVPPNYDFIDSIPYEIISNIYIPETDSSFIDGNSSTDVYIDKLLDQAYVQTNNFEDTVKNDPQRGCFYPGGIIRVFDTRLNTYIGMEGVRVRARRWFTTYYAFPDYNGNYRMKSCFRRPCNYSLVYARSYFAIRWHLFGTTAWINGPKLNGDWNFDMADGIYRFAGHIFRGAFRYNYKDIEGLARPGSFFNYRRQVYIAVNDNKNWQGINWEVFPIIKIARFRGETDAEYDSDEIFSTTCHETGHTTHYLAVGTLQFLLTTSEIRESWAIGIEWLLTHLEYAERGINNYGDETYSPANPPEYPNQYAYQYWGKEQGADDYTSLFINLIDNYNELGHFFPNVLLTGTINDQVSGYTLPNIESYLSSSFSLQSLSVQLKGHKPAGVSDAQIDLLLSFY